MPFHFTLLKSVAFYVLYVTVSEPWYVYKCCMLVFIFVIVRYCWHALIFPRVLSSHLLSELFSQTWYPVLHEFDNICDIRGFLHSGKQEQFLSLDFSLPTA